MWVVSIFKNNFTTHETKSMPNMDKTGPQGQGPATGRGQGECSESKKESLRPCGRGCGRGRGMGRGFGQEVKTDEDKA